MSAPTSDYSVVLLGRFAGKDRAVALALAKAFGESETWGLQVVGATPITLLTDLSLVQAQAVYRELIPVERDAGCRFRVQPGREEGYPTVSWGRIPLLYGRQISEFSGSGSQAAPPLQPAAALAASPGAASASGPAPAPLACPHCGKPVAVKLLPALAPALPAPAGARPLPLVGAAAGVKAVPIPVPKPALPSPARPAAAPPPAPSSSPEIEPMDVEEFEELVPLGEGAGAPPKSSSQRAAALLPEVPVVETAAPPATERSTLTPMDPRLSGPMALEEFEKGLVMGPSKETESIDRASASPIRPGRSDRALAQPRGSGGISKAPPQGPKRPSSARLQRWVDDDPDQLCSIFIGRNNSPKVHELVAEIQGITAKEAQRICQKSVVPIVKDIPVSEAEAIKQRFEELNVFPRVTLKR